MVQGTERKGFHWERARALACKEKRCTEHAKKPRQNYLLFNTCFTQKKQDKVCSCNSKTAQRLPRFVGGGIANEKEGFFYIRRIAYLIRHLIYMNIEYVTSLSEADLDPPPRIKQTFTPNQMVLFLGPIQALLFSSCEHETQYFHFPFPS